MRLLASIPHSARSDRGFSMVTVVFVMLALSSVGLALSTMFSTRSLSSVVSFQADQAFYVAEAGLQYVIANHFLNDADFSNNIAPTPAPFGTGAISFGTGHFWVQYSNLAAAQATITVTAKVGDSLRKISQTVTKQNNVSPYAISSLGNISMQGGVGTINGSISASGNISNQANWAITGTSTQSNSSLTTITININDYVVLTNTTYSGDLDISGNYATNIYVQGNVDIANDTTITSNMIVATGNIHIGKNVTLSGGTLAASGNIDANNVGNVNLTGPANGKPVLAATGNIHITSKDGPVTITGYLLSQGNIHFTTQNNSSVTFNGYMQMNGNAQLSNQGTMVLTYDPNVGSSQGAVVVLKDWQELL